MSTVVLVLLVSNSIVAFVRARLFSIVESKKLYYNISILGVYKKSVFVRLCVPQCLSYVKLLEFTTGYIFIKTICSFQGVKL